LINADGLANDINDVVKDAREGILSLPLQWLAQIDGHASFRRDVIDAFFEKAAQELRQSVSRAECLNSELRSPVIDILIKDIRDLAEELREQ